jgi:hypothetical protein
MKIYGMKVWLEPDHRIPAFLRLGYERIEVPIKDVLLKGIHPESVMGVSGDYCQAAELFSRKLNEAEHRFDSLSVQHLNAEIVMAQHGNYHDRRTALERTLEMVGHGVYFAEDVSYDRIVKLARKYVSSHWSHERAWNLLRSSRSGFSELRAFLKQKHPKLKVGSYDDMNDLDLANLLSVGDFMDEEQSLVLEALCCRNFRKVSALRGLTDDRHRLRFRDRIDWFELVINNGRLHDHGQVKYSCGVHGNMVHFEPELTHAVAQRKFAKEFARSYRTSGGDYCFVASMARLQEILDREEVAVRFSNVRYLQRIYPLNSSARLRKEQIPRFGITWRKMETLDQFRDALRAHGWKISGRKSDLVKRTAKLAADRYAEIAPMLSEWFSDQRFVRVPKDQTFAEPFPLLEDESLKNLLLSMFLLRHLRGNTVVDTNHENQSVQPEDMAEALLNGKASLTGCFLKV